MRLEKVKFINMAKGNKINMDGLSWWAIVILWDKTWAEGIVGVLEMKKAWRK